MKIKRIDIQNYRQFRQESICMEEKITFLAGANNSGKTSIIELMNRMFGETSVMISVHDFPIKTYSNWVNQCIELVRTVYKQFPQKESFMEELQKAFVGTEDDDGKYAKQIEDDSMKIKLEVGYQNDDIIELFSPYLMDLDEKTYRFFFMYQYKFFHNIFINLLDKQFDKCENLLNNISDSAAENENKEKERKEKEFIKLLGRIIEQCYKGQYYYSDKEYTNLQKFDNEKDFQNLFHYKHIFASRDMPDEKGDKKKNTISTAMMNFMGKDEWEGLFREWPQMIMGRIEEDKIKEKIRKHSLESLTDVINNISETNGGRSEEIVVESDVTTDDIKSLLQNVSHAKYKIGAYTFDEETQGLGYSNMIYMHLQLQKYMKEMQQEEQKRKVNFFVIEEPEAHMHPQMQKEFVRYLLKTYESKKMQGIVTTHSSEVVRIADLPSLRVVRRKQDIFEKRICDMSCFLENLRREDKKRGKSIENNYNLLFQLNYADIIFADKIIMFEGDTERMYLKQLLQKKEYRELEKQYIAYVQVGGAYTHWYKELIEYLQIKTLILTDIDYEKEITCIEKIKKNYTSNGGIKAYYLYQKEKSPKVEKVESDEYESNKVQIEDLYSWQETEKNKISDYIMVSFQGETDGYTRTLEEAMLSKLFNINVEDTFTVTEWQAKKTESGIDFKIPRAKKKENVDSEQLEKAEEIVEFKEVEKIDEHGEAEKVGVRDIVTSTSNYKTDFMYSVILKEKVQEMLPHYIEEGLKWLMK